MVTEYQSVNDFAWRLSQQIFEEAQA